MTTSETKQADSSLEYRIVDKKLIPKVLESTNERMVPILGPLNDSLPMLDPFILVDHFSCRPPAGFTDHPHRGFEAITYLLEGSMQHEDCFGNKGQLKEGDLQVMTCGKGIVHAEQPVQLEGKAFSSGIQIWLNMKKKDRLSKPKYQERDSKTRQTKELTEGVNVKVVMGSYDGLRSTAKTGVKCLLLDLECKPSKSFQLDIKKELETVLIYVLEGELQIGKTKLKSGNLCTFQSPPSSPTSTPKLENNTESDPKFDSQAEEVFPIKVDIKAKKTRFILLAGQPTKEPVEVEGFFVMSNRKEVEQAKQDFMNKTKGFEKAKGWKSTISSKSR